MESSAADRYRHFTTAYVVIMAVAMTKLIAAADSARWGLDDVTARVGVLFRYRLTSRLSYAIDDSCVAQLKVALIYARYFVLLANMVVAEHCTS